MDRHHRGGLLGAAIMHPFADRGHDLYETPEVATYALLEVETLPHALWECACGPGAIVRVLRNRGHQVLATDLIDYQSADQDQAGVDFLVQQQLPVDDIEMILTNPPFRHIQRFVENALKLCPKVIILARLALMESERRSSILDTGALARVHVFRKRLPMMHRAGWEGRKASSGMAFAWFVFDRDHCGPATIDRISWEPSEFWT
jgi:hypothetical protein